MSQADGDETDAPGPSRVRGRRRAQTGPRGGSSGRPHRRPSVFGVIGELLITAGVLVLLFLGWQVWWNSLVVSGQQTSAAEAQARKWLSEATAPPTPATTPSPSATPAPPVPPVMQEPADYQPFAVIYIPRLGPDWKRTIRETVDVTRVLNSYDAGVGHYRGTAMPGEVGNFAVAGHDSGWGNTFIDLSKLHIGDRIYVLTGDGWYTYTFRNFEYVQPTAVQVLLPVPREPQATPIDRLMTITTCNPPFHAAERLIAYNVFQSWAPTAQVPSEIAATVAAQKG